MPSVKSKIASLPSDIREEVCRRLHNGQGGPQILPWLNTEAAVLRVLEDRWNNEAVTPQNLSDWRKNGYQDWLEKNERQNNLRVLTKWALREATDISAGRISDASVAMVAGSVLEMVQVAEDPVAAIEQIEAVSRMVSAREQVTLAKENAAIRKAANDLRQQEVDMSRERMEKQTVEAFLKWQNAPEARAIMESRKPKNVVAAQLRELFFGPLETEGDHAETEGAA
jgi:hypothetical protein